MAASTALPNEQPEEDVSDLVFPKEFQNVETLLISEVHLLLENRKAQNENAEEEQELSEVFVKTLNYTQRFSKFKNREMIGAVRASLTAPVGNQQMHKFEMASLANLCPDTAEEAKSLIPSLQGRYGDDELTQMLEDIKATRSFQ